MVDEFGRGTGNNPPLFSKAIVALLEKRNIIYENQPVPFFVFTGSFPALLFLVQPCLVKIVPESRWMSLLLSINNPYAWGIFMKYP